MHASSNDATPGYADTASANMLFVFAIVAVATIGGFMFGYDSGVINGTQDGLQQAFSLTKFETGFLSPPCWSAAPSAPSLPDGSPI